MMKISGLISLMLVLLSLSVYANESKKTLSEKNKKHLTISSIEVRDVTLSYPEFATPYENYSMLNNLNHQVELVNFSGSLIGNLDQADFVVDKIINIGQKIWNVVEKGRPSSSYSNAKATALPQNAISWDQLSGWQAPHSKTISVVYKNAYGLEVVRFTYRIILLYGGSVNGVGKYIGYASVEPLEMTTSYMYTFNAKASVDATFNMGSNIAPLAGMILNIRWTVETVLKKITITHTYTLDGVGNISVPTDTRSIISNLK